MPELRHRVSGVKVRVSIAHPHLASSEWERLDIEPVVEQAKPQAVRKPRTRKTTTK